MARDFTSHLVSFEEGVFIREHPFDIMAVKVKRTISQINSARDELEKLEAKLDEHIAELNVRMKNK